MRGTGRTLAMRLRGYQDIPDALWPIYEVLGAERILSKFSASNLGLGFLWVSPVMLTPD